MREDTVAISQEGNFSWTAVVVGALAATAFSFVILAFGSAIGLAVSSSAPTWRDTSIALVLLSGLFLILQALVSFALGGYVAGRLRRTTPSSAALMETWDGAHGLAVWAIAVVLGAAVAVGTAAHTAASLAPMSSTSRATSSEPLLSYELDRLLRSARRSPNVDVAAERSEVGRTLLKANSHSGIPADDRAFLVAQVGALTGLSQPDAERRVDTAIVDSRASIRRARASSVLLAFSLAAATLLGAVAAWFAAAAAGRHRDGALVPVWLPANEPVQPFSKV